MDEVNEPITPAGDGRTAKGRFAPGNKAGKGNPHNKKTQRIRAALLKAATLDDVKAICAKLVEGAKGGDLKFIQEWLDRCIGKPSQTEIMERVEKLEQLIANRKDGERDEYQ